MNKKPLYEVARVFLKLGLIGFGGPAVHIAMMEEEVVRKKAWISPQHFLDLVGATNLIPGPNSTEMTMHCGQERAGWRGLVVAGCCFILPAVIITSFIAWAYQRYGQLPEVAPFIYGIKPAIISVILSAIISLGRKAVKSVQLAVIGIMCAAAALAGVSEMLVFLAAGLSGLLLFWMQHRGKIIGLFPLPLLQAVALLATVNYSSIFWLFLKIGAILYGSGYVLFAFLDAALVAKGLLTQQQLIDAIAVGQFTPGPVFSAATFIGWQLGGWQGAVAATAGIFLPSFLFVAFLNPLVPLLRRSQLMAAFLDTVNVAAIALIFAVVVDMSAVTITNWRTAVIALLSLVATITFKRLNTAFVVMGGALLGYVLALL